MLGHRTRIEYSSADDYVVVGLHTIRPVLMRFLVASPAVLFGGVFVWMLTVTTAGFSEQVWLSAMIGVCLFSVARTMVFPRPRIAPSSPEFTVMPGYRSAVTGHVVELEALLDAADAAAMTPRQRRQLNRVVKQTQYVATLLLLAARAQAPGDLSWWERVQMDDVEDVQQALAEQDNLLMQMRRELLTELRGAPAATAA